VRLEGVAEWTRDLAPGRPFVEEVETDAADLTLIVLDAAGRELIRYRPEPAVDQDPPQPATEPPLPAAIASNDELYITGLHLEQYRHATRHPEDYWREALRRDAGDSRCNNAMGRRHLYRGEFAEAAQYFHRAVATLTRRNPNPYDSEPYYNLGLTLRYLARDDEAYAAFYKATWTHAWQAPAFYAIAQIDAACGRWSTAIEHAQRAIRANPDFNQACNLAVVLLRKQGSPAEAAACLAETLALDPLDAWACWLDGRGIPGDNQMRFDVALDYLGAGLSAEAAEVLRGADFDAHDGSVPIILYALGEEHQASPDYCFPSRLEELQILERAIAANPADARAHHYLGNWLYDRRRHREAIAHWERAVELEPALAVAWRNLGIGAFNVLADPVRARAAFDRAFAANPADARVLYERDQLWKRIGIAPAIRLAEFERYPELVRLRDDLSVELAALYNQTAQPEKARDLLASRKFQPWEGGEGLALGQHERAHILLGRRALAEGDAAKARELFELALTCPENLGESRHPLVIPSEIYYLLGGEFRQRAAHAADYYAALSLRSLGSNETAESLLRALLRRARAQAGREVKVEYFATSLPAMLLFNDDLQKRNRIEALFLEAQARLGLGETAESRALLDEILRLDQNHPGARDLRATL
jgi:tetratricopeptide (TPR) repeat protein